MVSEKRKIGDIGEEIACKYLVNKGFHVKTRNYLKKWGEIDIVAQNKDIMHFIEVKTVSRENFSRETGNYSARPEENVTREKIERIHRAIQSYLEEFSQETAKLDWQIDVIAVELSFHGKQAKVRYLPNITIN